MEEITRHVAVLLAVLAACFVGPAIAIYVFAKRKKRARQSRRSPLGAELLRGPGHSLREQIDEATDDLMGDFIALMIVPTTMLSLFLAHSILLGAGNTPLLVPLYGTLVLAFVAYMARKVFSAGALLDNLKVGYDAEVAAGQELDQLMRQGAATFHDFPADNFNIDHVVVASAGVFAIETKGVTKPIRGRGTADATVEFDGKALKFPTWTTQGPLEQAARQADWLAKWLTSAVGAPVSVTPVLALPGWFVYRTGRGRVNVYSGKELPGLLKARGNQQLTPQDVQRIVHQVEQRCRTVSPLYSDAGEKR